MRRLQTRFVADISRYTENFFLGMSPRQTVLGIAGGALMVLGALLPQFPDVAGFLGGFGLIAAGFLRPDGLPLERYVRAWLDARLVNPLHRHYEPDNIPYDYLWEGRVQGRVCFRPADFRERASPPEGPEEQPLSPPEMAAESAAEKPAKRPAATSPAAPPPGPERCALPARKASRIPAYGSGPSVRLPGRRAE